MIDVLPSVEYIVLVLIAAVMLLLTTALALYLALRISLRHRQELEEDNKDKKFLIKQMSADNYTLSHRIAEQSAIIKRGVTPMTPTKAKQIAEELFRHPKVVDRRKLFRTKQEMVQANRDGDDAA